MRGTSDKTQQFNRRIAIHKRVAVTDELGTKDYTFALYAEAWAAFIPMRGRQFFGASQMQAELTAIFRLRYRTDLDPTMRIVYNGENFDLAAPPVDVDGAHTVIELLCRNGVGDGRETP